MPLTQRSLSIKKKANSWESARGLVILLLRDFFRTFGFILLRAVFPFVIYFFFSSTWRVYVCAGHSCAADGCVRMSRWLAKIYMDTNRSFILKWQSTVEANKEIGLNCVFAVAARWVSVYTTFFHIECVCVSVRVVCSFIAHWTISLRGCGIHSYTTLNVFPVEYLLFFCCCCRLWATFVLLRSWMGWHLWLSAPLFMWRIHSHYISKWFSGAIQNERFLNDFFREWTTKFYWEIFDRNLPEIKDDKNYYLLMIRFGMQTFKDPK